MWHTSLDVDGQGLCFHMIPGYFHLHHAGLAVQRLLLIKDEVADAVVDIPAFVVLYGLQRMRMVTDQRIRPGVYQPVGIQPLTGYGLQGVFAAPVERHDDHGLRVLPLDVTDAPDNLLRPFGVHAGTVGQVGKILQRHAQ